MELQKNPQHIVWLDVVRFVAMFTVVCCHCTDPFNFYPGTAPNIDEIKLWGAIYGALLRPCVPLFVMITGALLLPVRGEVSVFYKKRIPVFYGHSSSGRSSTTFSPGSRVCWASNRKLFSTFSLIRAKK